MRLRDVQCCGEDAEKKTPWEDVLRKPLCVRLLTELLFWPLGDALQSVLVSTNRVSRFAAILNLIIRLSFSLRSILWAELRICGLGFGKWIAQWTDIWTAQQITEPSTADNCVVEGYPTGHCEVLRKIIMLNIHFSFFFLFTDGAVINLLVRISFLKYAQLYEH